MSVWRFEASNAYNRYNCLLLLPKLLLLLLLLTCEVRCEARHVIPANSVQALLL